MTIHAAPCDADEAAGALPGSRVALADLTEAGAGRTMAATLPTPPDILVLNASIEVRARWSDVTADEADRQLAFNLREQLDMVQAVVPGMQARGWGRLLLIGSVQSARPHPAMIVYAATKAALASMARSLAREVAAQGVTVNVLSPGAIETRRNADALADPDYRAQVLRAIPAGRLGQPQDCAGLALLLCSDAAAYVTGAELRVDGGMSL